LKSFPSTQTAHTTILMVSLSCLFLHCGEGTDLGSALDAMGLISIGVVVLNGEGTLCIGHFEKKLGKL